MWSRCLVWMCREVGEGASEGSGTEAAKDLGVDVQAQVILDLPAQRPHLIVVSTVGSVPGRGSNIARTDNSKGTVWAYQTGLQDVQQHAAVAPQKRLRRRRPRANQPSRTTTCSGRG